MRKGWHTISLLSVRFTLMSSALQFSEMLKPWLVCRNRAILESKWILCGICGFLSLLSFQNMAHLWVFVLLDFWGVFWGMQYAFYLKQVVCTAPYLSKDTKKEMLWRLREWIYGCQGRMGERDSWGVWDQHPILWPPDVKKWLLKKGPDAGKDWRQEEKRVTEDEMVG